MTTLFAKEIHEKNKIENGRYILVSTNWMIDHLPVYFKNGRFVKYTKTDLSEEELIQYTHFIKHFNGIDTMNTPIVYEEIIEPEILNMDDTDVYCFNDKNHQPFMIYKKDNHVFIQSGERENIQCMYNGLIGWRDFTFPKDTIIHNTVKLSKKQVEEVIKVFTYFKKNLKLPDINTDITCRGFKYNSFIEGNGQECTIQESSSAMSCNIWFGISQPKITFNDKVFEDEKYFIQQFNDGNIEEFDNQNYKLKHLNLPSRIHISDFYMKPMIDCLKRFI